ncbi:MAG TPA: DUF1003 domain-containing protein [Candidatus Binataceae bacterium]|jgi:uncharacterized membrane protein|nr:DUF1003 domain-containing protein [Candidatus Binataceae bacterium]
MAATPTVEKWNAMRVHHVHRHPRVRNINEIAPLTLGQRVADRFANVMGSWSFIIIQSIILAAWVTINVVAYVWRWDPYPFILLNLALSFQAAYAAPIIMMSQNRQSEKDRVAAENDYQINVKAEEEVKAIMSHLEQQDEMMIDILHHLETQHKQMLDRLAPPSNGPPN